MQVRMDGDVAVLSGVGPLMNDPRYPSAAGDLKELLEVGCRRFVLEASDIREAGSPLLGLLLTLTREVRHWRGELVLARPSRALRGAMEEMQLEEYWDVFETVDDALAFFRRHEVGPGGVAGDA
jgi:anti-anti-sigma regulatory factor